MTNTHLPQNWIQKLCALLSVTGWLTGNLPHQVGRFFVAWAQAEGGTARWNPLNTTDHIRDAFGAWQGADYNSTGVANYSSPFHGIVATAATLLEGPYSSLLDALRGAAATGITAEQLVSQHEAEIKTWGTNPSLMLEILKTTP